MDLTRTLIIGNSGSGKSWLAQRLAERLQVPWTDLDRIHWLSDEHSIPRPRAEALAMAMARIAAEQERWVIEGVYGFANIRQREANDDERLIALLEWAGSYRQRDGSSGYTAHRPLFEGFDGCRIQLMDWTEITDFASAMHYAD
ncbi:adenylate kinase [Pseudomonas putida]|nr:adenylate kinase [Pseudomonas putida]